MSIASRIEAIEQHLTDDYSVLTLAGVDLTNVDKNILNLKTTWQERLLYFINNGTDVVWNNWDKVTGEGTILTLNNTEEAPMKIDLKGNTSQEGTPTPETPQDIHVVSGDNSIVVCGKNLFKEWVSGSVDNSGNFTPTSRNRTDYIQVQPSTTYTLWRENTGFATYMYQYNENKVWIKTSTITSANTTLTLTTDENTKYAVLFQYTGYSPTNKAQLELGNQSTTYEEYKGASYPITLPEGMFLGWIPNTDYRDRIFQAKTGDTYYDSLDSTTKESLTYGKWYLNKQIGKVVLNSSENWSKSSSSTNDIFVGNDVLSNNASLTNRASSISNYFTYNQSITITNKFYITDNKKTVAIVFTAHGNTTLEQFITWISTHNTSVYYILETPTYTEITDSTLLSQLNALAKSYASQTNISQENNDLPFIINATALREMS